MDSQILDAMRRSFLLKVIFLGLSGWTLFLTKIFSFENVFLFLSLLAIMIYQRPFNELKKMFPVHFFFVLLVCFILLPTIPVFFYWPLGPSSESFIHQRFSGLIVFFYVIILFWQLKPTTSQVWWSLILSTLAILIVLFYEGLEIETIQEFKNHRFGYELTPHAIHFGIFSNLLLIVLLGGFIWARRNGYSALFFLNLAIIIALTGVILSESRTAWIGLPEALVAWSIYYYVFIKSQSNSKRYFKFILIPLAIIVTLSFGLSDRVEKRWDAMISDVKNFSDARALGSIGQRLVMWEVGSQGFLENPFRGVGEDRAIEYLAEVSQEITFEKLGIRQSIVYGHLHNQYIHEAYTRGVLAVSGLLLFMGYVLYVFLSRIKSSGISSDIKVWSMSGFVFLVASSLAMLTEATIHLSNGVAFFIFYLTLYYMLSRRRDSDSVV